MLSPFLFFSKAGDINSLNLLVYLFIYLFFFFLSNITNNQQIPYSAIANFDKNQPRPVAMKWQPLPTSWQRVLAGFLESTVFSLSYTVLVTRLLACV